MPRWMTKRVLPKIGAVLSVVTSFVECLIIENVCIYVK